MGTEKSANDEWIELYNDTTSPVSLDGWILKSTIGKLKIDLAGIIPAKGFYLLERTDDNTLPNVNADLIYTGALKNTGENLELYNNLASLTDSANFPEGWPTGDNKTKQTMERVDFSQWQTSQTPGGTPKAKNSTVTQSQIIEQVKLDEAPKTENSTTTQNQTIEQVKKVYPSEIVINEVLPSPEGSDLEGEWIEIFNRNDFEVDLSEWKIFDVLGTVKIYTFPVNTKVFPKGFLVLSRPTTGITLNNSGDGLKLSQPDENVIDSVNYENAPKGESYNRTGSEWFWNTSLTPGIINQIVSPEKESSQKKQTRLEGKGSTTTNKGLAAISEPLIKNEERPKSFLIPLTALIISLFSGIVILLLKKKVKSLN